MLAPTVQHETALSNRPRIEGVEGPAIGADLRVCTAAHAFVFRPNSGPFLQGAQRVLALAPCRAPARIFRPLGNRATAFPTVDAPRRAPAMSQMHS